MKFKEKLNKLKEKMVSLYNENKALVLTAIILNLVFMVITILSLCGLNIAELSCNNAFLTKLNSWMYAHGLVYTVYGIMFAINIYFGIAVTSNDYSAKPLIYTVCLTPIFVILQYCVGVVNTMAMSYLVPLCINLSYSFKFSTLWKSALFLGIVTLYQYLMMLTKLSIFGLAYLSTDLLTYVLLAIDLYVLYIFYLCICKSIYKNKLKKEE